MFVLKYITLFWLILPRMLLTVALFKYQHHQEGEINFLTVTTVGDVSKRLSVVTNASLLCGC